MNGGDIRFTVLLHLHLFILHPSASILALVDQFGRVENAIHGVLMFRKASTIA